MDGLQVFKSHLDSSFNVMIVYSESSLYADVKKCFDIAGHAFLVHDKRMIVIDGSVVSESWFSKDHLLVIQAHEIGHHLAGHALIESHGRHDPKIEKEADWLGHRILKSFDENTAADLHREEYHARYGTFPEDDNGFEKTLGKLI